MHSCLDRGHADSLATWKRGRQDSSAQKLERVTRRKLHHRRAVQAVLHKVSERGATDSTTRWRDASEAAACGSTHVERVRAVLRARSTRAWRDTRACGPVRPPNEQPRLGRCNAGGRLIHAARLLSLRTPREIAQHVSRRSLAPQASVCLGLHPCSALGALLQGVHTRALPFTACAA